MTLAIVLALASVAALAGCSASDEDGSDPDATAGPDRPTIVVTTSILGDVTGNVVGDLADVEVLMPAGADPHSFEPSAQQAAELREADVVIANGLGLEAGFTETLELVQAEGTPVFAVAPELSPIPFSGGHEHGELDPHVWMDPERMAAASLLIADEVATATGLDAGELESRALAYGDELRAVDEEVQGLLAPIPEDQRVLVTNHEALGYFAERYGFEVVATVIPGGGTAAEPSAADLAELADVLTGEGVRAIFAEHVDDTSLAETLAAEVGGDVRIVTLFTDSLGDPGSGADTYTGLLITNARLVADALAT